MGGGGARGRGQTGAASCDQQGEGRRHRCRGRCLPERRPRWPRLPPPPAERPWLPAGHAGTWDGKVAAVGRQPPAVAAAVD